MSRIDATLESSIITCEALLGKNPISDDSKADATLGGLRAGCSLCGSRVGLCLRQVTEKLISLSLSLARSLSLFPSVSLSVCLSHSVALLSLPLSLSPSLCLSLSVSLSLSCLPLSSLSLSCLSLSSRSLSPSLRLSPSLDFSLSVSPLRLPLRLFEYNYREKDRSR
jgi:hypothetical protein